MKRSFVSILILALAISVGADEDENTWLLRYKDHTFAEIKLLAQPTLEDPDLISDDRDHGKTTTFSVRDDIASRIRVIYTGESRKISSARKRIISFWINGNGIKKSADVFQSEFLFVEMSDRYWIPVQSPLIPYFQDELQKGEEVIIFANWIATSKDSSGNSEWVFLVNEFEKLAEP